MRATTRPESVRKAFEVDLVNLVEDRHHSLLNDLVLECRDAQRALPPISLRDIDSSRRSCPIRSTVHPVVKIGEPTLQPGFILLPRHTIYSGRGLPLQSVKAVPEQIQGHMVKQSGEPFLLPYRCYLSHTIQPPGTCVFRSVSEACVIERCSPLSAPFPPRPPRRVAPPCSVGSTVLRHSPTSPARARPPFGLWPSRTGLRDQPKALWRSPGSRACCFS